MLANFSIFKISHLCIFFGALIFCTGGYAREINGINTTPAAANIEPNVAAPTASENTATSPSTTADESPMMLYLVPWNANPANNKNGKKFTLYQPWGSHFDPLTPSQTAQLNSL